MTTIVYYMAHPVGSDATRADNLARAERWFRWLIETTDYAIVAPWLLYCRAWDERPDRRERGIRDDLAMLVRCDGIVLVGGAISAGMRAELDAATARGLAVLDFTHMGPEPPAASPLDEAHDTRAKILHRRAREYAADIHPEGTDGALDVLAESLLRRAVAACISARGKVG